VSSWPVTEGLFELGDPEVERGGVIRGARLAVAGTRHPNAAKDNVIVHPCSYTATHADLADLIGPDLVLDPRDGSSSSPTCSPRGCPPAPRTTWTFLLWSPPDNVRVVGEGGGGALREIIARSYNAAAAHCQAKALNRARLR
jgi:hypothetical protein